MAKVRITRKQDLKNKTNEVPPHLVSIVPEDFLKCQKGPK